MLRAKSILEAMKPWLEAKLAAVSGKSTIAEARSRCALSRWAGLTRYLDDGRIEIDNNVVERAMRPIALGRKNHLFAVPDEGGTPLGRPRLAHRNCQNERSRPAKLPPRRCPSLRSPAAIP